jgi:branched-subunit amino acid ABC-type transport system permease component
MDIDIIGSLLYQFADNMAFLLLSALGLIIILGVLNIVNLAHGELIMIGAYATSICYYAGLPLVLCFVVAVMSVGLIGVGLERAIIRRFYNNKIGAMVATWGVSLIISQGTFLLLGPSMRPIPLPSWQISLGIYSFSGYRVMLFIAALIVVALLWIYFHRVRAGIFTRATMQDSAMAEAIGINTVAIGTLAFAIGAGMAGLTGALYSPTQSLVPLMGTTYTAMAFITVVVGGGVDPILGALVSSALLAAVATPLAAAFGTFIGRVGVLIAALVIIRIMPNGISGYITLARRRRQSVIAGKA